MTTETSLSEMKLTSPVVIEQVGNQGRTWTTWGAVSGICLGILSPIIGSLLTAVAWFAGAEWHGLHLQRTGTVLFVLTIPLLAFGAHCLDLSDRRDAEARKRNSSN